MQSSLGTCFLSTAMILIFRTSDGDSHGEVVDTRRHLLPLVTEYIYEPFVLEPLHDHAIIFGLICGDGDCSVVDRPETPLGNPSIITSQYTFSPDIPLADGRLPTPSHPPGIVLPLCMIIRNSRNQHHSFWHQGISRGYSSEVSNKPGTENIFPGRHRPRQAAREKTSLHAGPQPGRQGRDEKNVHFCQYLTLSAPRGSLRRKFLIHLLHEKP